MKPTKTINVICPKCGARFSRHCISTRTPSANTLGGGWGGPVPLVRSHPERVQAARDRDQKRAEKRAEWKARAAARAQENTP